MSEITKLYENAGIKKLLYCDICKAQEHALGLCAETKCEPFYPPFTPEKQIELIKLLINHPMLDEISLFFNEPSKTYNLRVYSLPEIGDFRSTYTETQNSFEDMLAGLINNLWQDLTEEEKQQVKGILE